MVDLADSEEYDFHFQGSGFNALVMNWVDSESSDEASDLVASAWEVEVLGLTAPKIPQMTSETKSSVNAALKQIMNSDPKVKECKYFAMYTVLSAQDLILISFLLYRV